MGCCADVEFVLCEPSSVYAVAEVVIVAGAKRDLSQRADRLRGPASCIDHIRHRIYAGRGGHFQITAFAVQPGGVVVSAIVDGGHAGNAAQSVQRAVQKIRSGQVVVAAGVQR